MDCKTRDYFEDILVDWEDTLIEVFNRTERPRWEIAAEQMKTTFCRRVDAVLESAKEEYGYFD